MTSGTLRRTRILVVDDDVRIQRMLAQYLGEEGFDVDVAGSSSQMRARMAGAKFDAVLLDVVLPGDCDGLQLAREIRSGSDVPIIMLSGRDDVMDRVVGLEVGADDYIGKPFHLREVLARVRTVLRRRTVSTEPAPPEEGVLRFAGWRLDVERRAVTNPAGDEVAMSTGEFDMLHVFATHAGRVMTRDILMDLTHKRGRDGFDRTIDALIVRLRRKIETDPANPSLIKSVRGVGYLFTARPETASGRS
ncbi:response regulator transcription factor [Rhizobium redzepovicii]|uniref:Regulatory protein VirG n=1 Tax=Rhizobium redzepovicii TaxID=2867518 RepID=A0AAW8P9Y3_9HYPH|nr:MULTISPECIES: response regulator transcription factor [Rhizobium]MBB3523196.1 two-component system phosphate regulon response regulator OmpR [Rhizobium sp. BK456]MBY4613542.1 response regulator transcription factor [Rhizobium redzepovicii]MDF0658897.1 response regulator transcription factor [Rhizobium sp. BC49]MDR9763852.1 response regulator transcription factor [Rhizobium redzepovicii]MDR9782065.1 response regulator transcription factor [Rhizobium redzepovicii]